VTVRWVFVYSSISGRCQRKFAETVNRVGRSQDLPMHTEFLPAVRHSNSVCISVVDLVLVSYRYYTGGATKFAFRAGEGNQRNKKFSDI
jgi:hypothetical protein